MVSINKWDVIIFSLLNLLVIPSLSYDPTWDSLDTRPLPQWYDDAKIGIFIHWGVFSVPSFGSEWFWHLWIGDLANSIRSNTDLKFGVYHSLYEWFNPLYLQDKSTDYSTQLFVKQKTIPELHELVNTYKPDIIWSDGEYEAPDSYWTSTDFLAWLYNESPVKDTVVVNDRWGDGILCAHGDFYTCHDRYNPGVLLPYKWENAISIDRNSWGYRRNAKLSDYLTPEELIATLVQTISCGGNLLINVGPTKDGIITPIFEERLRQLGSWLEINGEAINSSRPWMYQNDTTTSGVWYTMTSDDVENFAVYAMVLQWPTNRTLLLGAPEIYDEAILTLLGASGNLTWSRSEEGISVTFPGRDKVSSKWAWVIRLTGVLN